MVLVIFTLQTPSQADDIRDFQIEGMSVGDSALDYFSEEEINNNSGHWWPDKTYTQVAFSGVELYHKVFFSYKTGDKKYIIYSLSGNILFDNINDCYKEQKKIRNRLAWIDKRFKTIENEIEKERVLTNNPDYKDKYEILEGALNNMNNLEKEYLELMEEQERLLK